MARRQVGHSVFGHSHPPGLGTGRRVYLSRAHNSAIDTAGPVPLYHAGANLTKFEAAGDNHAIKVRSCSIHLRLLFSLDLRPAISDDNGLHAQQPADEEGVLILVPLSRGRNGYKRGYLFIVPESEW